MPKPPSNPPPAGSNGLTYLIVGGVSVGALAFMFLLFGELFVMAAAVFGLVGAVGALHYFVWGRSMTEHAKKEAKAELSGDGPP